MNKKVIIAFLSIVIFLIALIIYLDQKGKEVIPVYSDNRDCEKPGPGRINPAVRDPYCLFKNKGSSKTAKGRLNLQ